MDGEAIIAVIMGVVLACFSLMMVGYSFFRGEGFAASKGDSPGALPGEGAEAVAGAGVGLDSILDSMETLELEYQLGNMPEEQYREQLQAYRLEAAAAIKAQLESGAASPELMLELDVISARAELMPTTPSGTWGSCTRCDAPVPLSEAPCPHCGALVGPARSSTETGPALPH